MALIEFDNYKSELGSYRPTLDEIKGSLDLDNKKQRIAEMERQMEEPGFWDDPERSTKIVKEANSLKSAVTRDEKLARQ